MDKTEISKALHDLIGDEVAKIVKEITEKRMDEETKANKAKADTVPEMLKNAGARLETKGVDDERGFVLARTIRAMAAGKGDVFRAAQFAQKNYGDASAVTKILSSDDHSAGGALVPLAQSSEVIELLRPASVFRQLNPMYPPMPNGNMSMPKITGGATAQYIGEKNAIPVSEGAYGTVRLVAKKLGAFIPVTNDLIRYTGPKTDAIIRDDAVMSLGQKSDITFIRGNGSEFSPMGLRYLCKAANLIPANATINLQNVTDDLSKLILALWNANVRMIRPGFIISPRTAMFLRNLRNTDGYPIYKEEMMTGTLEGFPYRVSTQIPQNLGTGANETEIYLADFADVMLGETENLMVDVSSEGTYVDGSGATVSAFQNDLTLVRVIALHDLNLRHAESVAVLTGVKWGA